VLAFVTTVMGFLGGLVMSAIKRDRGVKDRGWIIQGRRGVLDRLDSVVFAAPVLFHTTSLVDLEFPGFSGDLVARADCSIQTHQG
jgi:predicted CDP-diglyceride synthetase/phosphatidate cytidylyltransferase